MLWPQNNARARLRRLAHALSCSPRTRLDLGEAPHKPLGEQRRHSTIRLIARVVGVETADMLVNEILTRHLPNHNVVVSCTGLTGSPDESGRRRRKKALARARNARVRCGMIRLAWRLLTQRLETALVT
ncbi:MAG: transposase [Methylocystis sp.]